MSHKNEPKKYILQIRKRSHASLRLPSIQERWWRFILGGLCPNYYNSHARRSNLLYFSLL